MSTECYYDLLTNYYHLIYNDWEHDIIRQAKALDRIIKDNFGYNIQTILDASCGIGTQSIGLAKIGYTVVGNDISSKAIARAKMESITRGVSIDFQQSDMRLLKEHITSQFDLVIACDNSIPHLLNDHDIQLAFEQFFQVLKPCGGCIVSVRDYSKINKKYNRIVPRTLHYDGKLKIIMYDVWEFHENHYDMNTYIVKDDNKDPVVQVFRTRYYCITIDKLANLMADVGFSDIRILKGCFFQPVILGKKTC